MANGPLGEMLRRSVVLVSLLAGWSTVAFARMPQDDARTLLDRWLDDQNKGDFDDYQKLYAGDFIHANSLVSAVRSHAEV